MPKCELSIPLLPIHMLGVRTFYQPDQTAAARTTTKNGWNFTGTGQTRFSLSQPLELHIDYPILFLCFTTHCWVRFLSEQPGGGVDIGCKSFVNKQQKSSQTSKRCAAWGGDRVDGIFIRAHKKPLSHLSCKSFQPSLHIERKSVRHGKTHSIYILQSSSA